MAESGSYPALALAPEMQERIVAHARAEAPRECCGVILGDETGLHELVELTNLDPGTDFYRIDDGELFRIYRHADDRGWDFRVIYHSHPVSPAYPSRTDVSLAAWPDAVYLICSLAKPNAELHAFRIVNEAITEISIVDAS